jgi:MoaA/NifB/PqqE/SkfB family radical SAM enzyme
MTPADPARGRIDAEGRLILPPEFAARHGFMPGAQVTLTADSDGFILHRPLARPYKLYIEPTNQCNLQCRTCMRNAWTETLGQMRPETFSRVLAGLRAWSPVPSVFFGGLGEPLLHPNIVQMVARVKALGATVELITNGTLLDEKMSRCLIEAGLDRLWVSLDGARPESYTDVRLGAALPQVIANLSRFRDLRVPVHLPTPEIGIAFVAMRRNIADLPALLRLGRQLGAMHFLVTNILPYTREMQHEALYLDALTALPYLSSRWAPHLDLPKIDINRVTGGPLFEILQGEQTVTLAGSDLSRDTNRCPFIRAGAGAVGYDGRFSPCLPLLHEHTSYQRHRERASKPYSIGNINQTGLLDLWQMPEHITFRERVQSFGFSPCTYCGGCGFSETNEEDCYGNIFPTCGGCLWAQGIIRCP